MGMGIESLVLKNTSISWNFMIIYNLDKRDAN